MRVWRICRERHAAEAFSGEGARRFGGRWNSRGVRMVYTSTSLALAAIELFVHLEPGQAPGDLIALGAHLPEGEPAGRVAPDQLDENWWTDAEHWTRPVGDRWIESGSSLALEAPSASIRPEWNVLLNPAHPAAARLRIDPPTPFVFDGRMFARGADRM